MMFEEDKNRARIALDEEDVALVKTSCAMLSTTADVATRLFYERLFALDPETRALFTRDLNNQRAKFMATLNYMVEALDQPQRLRETTARLGREHARYGVLDEHYDTVSEALFWALAETLGPAFTPDVEMAWKKVYALLAGMMKEAARAS